MNEWIIAFLSLLSVSISAFLAYVFTSRTTRAQAIARFKEEKYARLLIKMQGFVGSTTSAQLKKEFFEEQYQSWIYASDEVVEAINRMVTLVIENRGKTPDLEQGNKAVGEVVLAMRKDLLPETKLSYTEFQYTDVK